MHRNFPPDQCTDQTKLVNIFDFDLHNPIFLLGVHFLYVIRIIILYYTPALNELWEIQLDVFWPSWFWLNISLA